MNDVTVVTSVTYPSPESLALVADVQYHEPYLSAALNRKFRGIVDSGFYAGFLPKPGGGMNLLITSVDGDKTAGAASVDIGEFYQVTIQHRKDISLALSAGKKYAIVLKGRYLLGEDTYQVNTASHIHAAEFVARTYTDSYQLGDGELLVCTVNIPAGVSAITQEMIDTSERINRTIGIDISDSVTSSRSDVAASSLAVKKAYDLAKSKYTAQDASTTQKGLVQLSSETNSDSETMAATPKAVKSVKDLADTKAPIESPSLTGTPTAPTAAQGTNSTQIANTAFVKAAITALINGAPGTLDTLKEIAAAINNDPNFSTTINNALALKAPLASPALTGIPTAPTAAQGTNNTQIATTAYVRAAISALVGSSPEALDTLNELAAALGNDPNFATTMTNALAGKQPLDATLTALAGLATGANKLPYFTGTDTVSQTDLTSVGRDILAKTSVLAVIQYLGLRELGTSGEKIPLLSTANTWSARQTFNGGITGALTGNADTATKLKTKRSLQVDLQSDNAIDFDGSSNALLGIKGILPITHGGLGASSVYGGRTNLGLGVADIPQFKGINLVNSTDSDLAASGIVSGYLNNSAGVQRSRFRIYSEIRSDNRSWLTLHLQSDTNTNKYAGLDIDGNFLITGDSKCRALEPTDVALTRKNIDVYSKAEIDLKKGMKFTRVNAPSGAEEGKFYPVVIKRSATSNGELASRVIISTAPRQAAHRMNNCEFNGFVMPAGWSDRGRYAYGMFWQYQDAERAIHSIAMSNKDDEVSSVFYIEGGAFPVCVLVEEGLSVVVPTTDYIVGQTTYKWGATNPKAECIAADIIIDFSNGRGFYSSGNLNGNAATATKLQTARTINGVTFDGTTDISLTPENIGALSLSGGTLLGGLTAPLLTTKSDLIFSSHTSRHIRFTYTKNDGTTLTDGYIFKDGVDNPNRRPGIRINCAAPNKETGNGTNSGDWIFGEDGIFTMPGGTVLRGGINSNGVPQSEYKHDMLTSVVDDAKMYLRRFRSSTGASIWHETIENNVYRLCTGTTDAQEELVLRTGSYAKFAGEIISKSANGLRIAYGNYGFFIRNDGSSTYFMLTASGDNLGTWNSLRPLTINNSNGAVSIGNGLNVTGDIRTNAWVYANRFSVNSSSGSWISMRDQNVIFGLNKVSTSSAQALLRQDHADRKFFIGGLGNSQFGFYMINNSRTSNGTDGQAFLDSSGNFQCGGQILPANYSNFDSRYTLKTSCVTSVRMGSAASYKPSSNGVSWTQNLGSGLVMTGIIVQETGSNSADNIGGIYYRPVQYCINGTWYTAASV
ncbi:phage tail protein [Escherichia coli]|uniref:tail fiber protein n=6 Tax=Escherichia coli TaxID=562 RepID=UPI002A09BCDA|nr:phage tail protein [Escherichia coli]